MIILSAGYVKKGKRIGCVGRRIQQKRVASFTQPRNFFFVPGFCADKFRRDKFYVRLFDCF